MIYILTYLKKGGAGLKQQCQVLRVSTSSTPQGVARSITNFIGRGYQVELRSIGAGALNQAVKGIITAGRTIKSGLGFAPAFCDLVVEGQERTAINLKIIQIDLGG